jgi:AraC family transcriptional regulator
MPRPEGTRGEVRFDMAGGGPHRVGRYLLRPAGIGMHSAGDGGVLDIMTCRFDPKAFARLTGLTDWNARRLRDCAALSSNMIVLLTGRLRNEVLCPGFAAVQAMDSLVQLLMIEIGRALQQSASGEGLTSGLAPWQLARIDERLRAEGVHWPTTQELAMLCGISRSHLSRSFSAVVGRSLADYATSIRLERAQHLMRSGDLTMGQIAFRLGFATPSAFGAAFRRATGMTPRRFARAVTHPDQHFSAYAATRPAHA